MPLPDHGPVERRLDRAARGNPHTVGKTQAQHNLLPISARLIQGEPLRVVAERVDMTGRTLRG
ncbi:MAG: hypothetical protein KDJ28_11265 [Candidatus Competibacteraceae bacterium]|nr:hypothetical protein [Candidatus Competibacteraceae bacterium]